MGKNLSRSEQDRLSADMNWRLQKNKPLMIDNGKSTAGSAMFYYCKMCCAQTACLGESDFSSRIPRHCAPCMEMIQYGYSETQKRFLELKD